MQIFVIGMHRSGTSMLARLLNALGVSLGDPSKLALSEPGKTWAMNAKGLWERRDVMLINERLLYSADATWCNIGRLDPEHFPADGLELFRGNAQTIVAELDEHRPWAIKDPRCCFTFPAWREVVTTPVCVFCLRNPVEIAASLERRNKFQTRFAIALWEKHMRCALKATVDVPRFTTRFDHLLEDPLRTCEELVLNLGNVGIDGLQIPPPPVLDEIIDRKLKHHTLGDVELSDFLNGPQLDLFSGLLSGDAFQRESFFELSQEARAVLEQKP